MADVAKITIRVSQGRMGQTISVRTTGARGTIPLNTISTDTNYPSQSPSDTAANFYHDVLTKAAATF